jgi:type IV pilus assembly protein PilV
MSSKHDHCGTSLLEVLITIVIISIGLLGLAGLQSRMQLSQMESYQRSQAILLLEDMASRIATNRYAAASYVTATNTVLGVGITCPTTTSTSTRQEIDAAQWCMALQGASEILGGAKAGAMIGGRGCVQSIGTNEYLVTVAWQGQTPVSAPPAGVTCAVNAFNDTNACTNDRCRRIVTTVVRIASLT